MSADLALPAARDAETQVIGGCIIDPQHVATMAKLLRPRDFTDPAHQLAAAELVEMHRKGEPIDVATLKQRLDRHKEFADYGGAAYLAGVGRDCITAAHVGHHAKIVADEALKRQIALAAADIANAARNGHAGGEVLADALATFDDIRRSHEPARDALRTFTFGELFAENPKLHEPIIHGILRAGETANLISMSKVGKSWLAYSLALSIVTGQPWLGQFETVAGRVLLIDNELHRETLAHRIPLVAEALEIFLEDYKSGLDVLPLRGNLHTLRELGRYFAEIVPGTYQLIIIDAKYRIIDPGSSENDNAAETQFYNLLDQYAAQSGAAIVAIHHSSKGSQSDKRVTDVGAGAGAQSRAADAHLVLREHEEEGVVVLEGAVRSFPPFAPLPLRWAFPLWQPADGIDPLKLKGRLTQTEQRQNDKDAEACSKIVGALLKEPGTARQLRERTGFSRERLQRLLDKLTADDQIKADEGDQSGNKCKVYFIPPGGVGD